MQPTIPRVSLPDDHVSSFFIDHRAEHVVRQLQIGNEFGQSLLQRLHLRQLAQGDLRPVLQAVADVPGQLPLVDHHLREQRGGIHGNLARLQRHVGYAKKAPKLAGFLEQIAKEQKIEIPEAQDKPELPIGKRYVERGTVVRLRRVPGLPLLKLLEKIEQSGYPIAISRLGLRKRTGDKDSYDVELGVTAYDRNDVAATTPATAPSGSSGGR